MITRIMKLHKHDDILIGRDLAKIFKNGYVYEIKEFAGECVITCLGESALQPDARSYPDYPNQNSTVGAIMNSNFYLQTKKEFAYFAAEKGKTFVDVADPDSEDSLETIHDWIDNWHKTLDCNLSLHEYLGLTLEEYNKWVTEPDCLADIIKNKNR